MASLIPSIFAQDLHTKIYIIGATIVLLVGIIFAITNTRSKVKQDEESLGTFRSFLRFFYGCFLKPHSGDGTENGQQDALESFYKAQAGVYDATRKKLLRGREDMLGLVAAQLVHKAAIKQTQGTKRIWVDACLPIPSQEDVANIKFRLEAVPVGISRPCPHLSPFQISSQVYTWLISLPLSAKSLVSDLLVLDGRM